MKIELTSEFKSDLAEIVSFIARDKPVAARNFKNELIKLLRKELLSPYHLKKSIYFNHPSYRDHIFKGYTTVIKIDSQQNIVYVIGILKYRASL